MPNPRFGALGAAFTVARSMQFTSLIIIIGLAGHFVDDITHPGSGNKQTVPPPLVAMLVVVCIAAFYVLVAEVVYLQGKALKAIHFLFFLAIDAVICIVLGIVTFFVGRPLSYLDCAALKSSGSSTTAFVDSVAANSLKSNDYVFVGASSTSCYEMKSIWGLGIAMAILFLFSLLIDGFLYDIKKNGLQAEKEVDV